MVELPGQFLNNTKETLTLKDADGKARDRMGLLNDESNDDKTCQRAVDGLDSLVLHSGTPGEKNKGGLFSKNGSVTKACLSILSESATEALEEMGGKVTTEEQLAQLIELIFKKALGKGIDRISEFLVDAQAYIEVEFTDLTSSTTLVGFRVYLSAGKEMASDLLKYLVGNLAHLLFGVEDPYNIDLGKALLEDIYLGVTVYSAQGLPSFIDTDGDEDVSMGVDVAVNLAGIADAAGMEGGVGTVRAGIVVRNAPQASLPRQYSASDGMDHDMWLFRMVLGFP